MKVLIIEDERLAAENLASAIESADQEVLILELLSTVADVRQWLEEHEAPDLIFSDIQLGDGQSFEALKEMKEYVPVIFCTAYDEYALKAFRANGIEYIVKPFAKETIKAALEKYKSLTRDDFKIKQKALEQLMKELNQVRSTAGSSILVHFKERIIPIRYEDIAFFYVEGENCHLLTKESKRYIVNKSLEELERLTGRDYFRVNRQFLINRTSIIDASQYFGRKLAVHSDPPFDRTITVSKNKVHSFLGWLAQE